MCLSFLTKRVEKYFILLVILSFSTAMLANDSIPDLRFHKLCKTSDAYFLHSFTDVSYVKFWSRYKKLTSVNSKLVINNKSGVEKYSFLNLTGFITKNLKEIQIRTLKADGTVIELDSSLVFRPNSYDKKLGLINYPIPGVEPGDTIETSYVYSEYLSKHEMMDFVNLYSNLPSLNTEYSVKTSPDHLLRYKAYNNFQKPQIISNDTLIYCLFKMENIKGLLENQNTCVPCELPYMYYTIDKKDSEIRTWKDVYNLEFNVITQPISFDYEKSSYYKKWKRKVIGKARDSSKYYKFMLLHEDIHNNIQMEAAMESEVIKSNGYFLKEKRLNPHSVRRLYRQLLEDLEIEYWAVFARSKRAGRIDPYFIRKGEFDHIFFAFDKGDGSMSLLYPHDASYKYQINEIPTSIYNTEAVIAKPYLTEKIKKREKFITSDFKLAEVDSVVVNMITLPGMSADHNYIKQVYYCNIGLKEKDTNFKSKFSVSGGLFTDIRSFFSILDQDEEASVFYDAFIEYEGNDTVFQIDTILNTNLTQTKPFNYTVNAQGTLKGALSFLNDSIVSISLDNLIQHSQIESGLESSDLNYYLDYSYTDFCIIMLNFPCDIEVLGIDNYNRNFNNDFLEYYLKLKLTGKKLLTLESNYKLMKDMIPKDAYDKLKEMNKFIKEIKNMRLIVKLKDS